MARVLLSGIAVLDYVFKVDQFPTKPSKYITHDMAVSLGGCAANAAYAVVRLSGVASLATRLGNDLVADQIESILHSAGVDTQFVRRLHNCKSSVSSIFVDNEGERLILHFRDKSLSSDASWIESAIDEQPENRFDAGLADTRWPAAACTVMALTRKYAVPGVLDVEANDEDLSDAYRNASHIAFSAEGLRDYTGNPARESALRLADRTVDGWVCVTDGALGVFYLKDDQLMQVPAYNIEAIDTLAAGDVWHGAFALSLGEGNSELDAIYFANATAALKCMRFGGTLGTPNRTEVERFQSEVERPKEILVAG